MILSGILIDERDKVLNGLENRFNVIQEEQLGEWLGLVVRKN